MSAIDDICAASEAIARARRQKVVICHPDDVNLADVKALAAKYDTSVIGNRYVPRGKLFLADDPRPRDAPI